MKAERIPSRGGTGGLMVSGLLAGGLSGLAVNLVLLGWVALAAPYYFTDLYRVTVVPLHLTVFAATLFGACGAAAGALVAAVRRWAPRAAPGAPRALLVGLAMAAVPAWVAAQMVAWVGLRGIGGLRLGFGVAAVGAGWIVLSGWLYRGLRRRAHLAGPAPRRPAWIWPAWAALLVATSLATARHLSAPPGPVPGTERGSGAPPPRTAANGPAARAIFLITADTLRADRLTPFGYGRDTSPNLAAFAREAVRFPRMISHSSGTVPSFCSLFAGTDPVFVRGNSQLSVLEESVDSVAERLQAAGYHTSAAVCQGFLTADRGFAQGFDRFVHLRESQKHPQKLLREAGALLDSRPSDRPLFFWFHFFNTHEPYEPDRRWFELMANGDASGGPRVPIYDYSTEGGLNRSVVGKAYRPETSAGEVELAWLNQLYDAEVRALDDAVGTLLERIRETGLWENSLIVFTADHGEALGEQGIFGRHCVGLHDAQVHVPLLIRFPGGAHAGAVRTAPVTTSDIAPTLLRGASLPPGPAMTGVDLWDVAAGARSPGGERPLVLQTAFGEGLTFFLNSYRYQRMDWALVADGYKYIHYANAALEEVQFPINYLNAWRETVTGHLRRDELHRVDGPDGEAEDLMTAEPETAARLLERLLSSPQLRFFLAGEGGAPRGVDPATVERLRSLGYL